MTSLLGFGTRPGRDMAGSAPHDSDGAARDRGGWTPLSAVALVCALAGCIAIRSVALVSTIGRLDGDEAVTGIMAREILHGQWFVYLAGENYMGALAQYLQAAVLWVLPSTPTTLRIVQVALCGVTCLLVGVLGRRMTGSPWGGVLAAAI